MTYIMDECKTAVSPLLTQCTKLSISSIHRTGQSGIPTTHTIKANTALYRQHMRKFVYTVSIFCGKYCLMTSWHRKPSHIIGRPLWGETERRTHVKLWCHSVILLFLLNKLFSKQSSAWKSGTLSSLIHKLPVWNEVLILLKTWIYSK